MESLNRRGNLQPSENILDVVGLETSSGNKPSPRIRFSSSCYRWSDRDVARRCRKLSPAKQNRGATGLSPDFACTLSLHQIHIYFVFENQIFDTIFNFFFENLFSLRIIGRFRYTVFFYWSWCCEKWRRENEEGFRIKKWMIDTFIFLIFPLIGFIFTVFVFERIFGEIIIFGINK